MDLSIIAEYEESWYGAGYADGLAGRRSVVNSVGDPESYRRGYEDGRNDR